ncbi:MAG: hypothetical protein ABIH83_01195 [Candidatus Micrarchaeota archaeon]
MRGQLSAEMLIILAIILGLVFIVFTQMTKTVKDTGEAVDERTGKLINATALSAEEMACVKDADCEKVDDAWECDVSKGHCTEK